MLRANRQLNAPLMIDYPDAAWQKQQLNGLFTLITDLLRAKALVPATLFILLLCKALFKDNGLFTAGKSVAWLSEPLLVTAPSRLR